MRRQGRAACLPHTALPAARILPVSPLSNAYARAAAHCAWETSVTTYPERGEGYQATPDEVNLSIGDAWRAPAR